MKQARVQRFDCCNPLFHLAIWKNGIVIQQTDPFVPPFEANPDADVVPSSPTEILWECQHFEGRVCSLKFAKYAHGGRIINYKHIKSG